MVYGICPVIECQRDGKVGGQIEVTEAPSLSVWRSGGVIHRNGRQEESWVGWCEK